MPLKPRRTTSRSKRDIRKELVEQTGDESLLFADGLDGAIIGVAEVGNLRVVYSKQMIVRILMRQNKWCWQDAIEYADFNIFGAHVGDRTPIYVIEPDTAISPNQHV